MMAASRSFTNCSDSSQQLHQLNVFSHLSCGSWNDKHILLYSMHSGYYVKTLLILFKSLQQEFSLFVFSLQVWAILLAAVPMTIQFSELLQCCSDCLTLQLEFSLDPCQYCLQCPEMASLGFLALLGGYRHPNPQKREYSPWLFSNDPVLVGFSVPLFAIAVDRKKCLPGPRCAPGKGWNHGVWEALCCWVEDWETLVLRCFLLLGRGAEETSTVGIICAGRGYTCSWQGLVWLPQILLLAD